MADAAALTEPCAEHPSRGARVDDLRVVAAQLGRPPRSVSRVMRRCPFGFPAVVEDLPYDAAGRPFPTLFYCTCPTLVAAVSALESAGGVAAFERRLEREPRLADSVKTAVRFTRRRRRDLVRRRGLATLDGGASLRTGVGGVADPRRLKCLHAHAAHALARHGYELGDQVLTAAGEIWCSDRRCAAFAPEAAG